ncbi:hypothetical protein T492DRAFT_151733 [Pavlovales sp. CCMP2436]|nr:hypothetical protein T492DRAFT_151733 [Pavlovales sp. CCMP2436]
MHKDYWLYGTECIYQSLYVYHYMVQNVFINLVCAPLHGTECIYQSSYVHHIATKHGQVCYSYLYLRWHFSPHKYLYYYIYI